jgi:dTMP kinase
LNSSTARFITFEGPEGSGKSTQVAQLAAALREAGWTVVVTREPGGTALGEALRELLLQADAPLGAEAEAYLMTGARAEHMRQVILPALAAGAVVLCDRFADSTLAYQGAGRGLPIEALRELQQLALGGEWPRLTILLDLPVEVGLARRARSGVRNRIDRENAAFHERVAAWYRLEAARCPARWRVIDATGDPGVVHTQILDAVSSMLGAHGRLSAAETGRP